MSLDAETQAAMLQALPHLRAFAVSLCRDVQHADDLVEDTLVRAAADVDAIQLRSNPRARLFMILRNGFHTEYRRRKWRGEDAYEKYATVVFADQTGRDMAKNLDGAMGRLSPHHREALVLIEGAELSYAEAAAIADCSVETMKGRVHEARLRLALLMGSCPRARH
jgi:RNA polymerase sigma-70 factor, ECF subfamily